MQQAYRVALICGSVPLLVGALIFILWLITRWDALMMAGLLTLCGGVVIVTIGAIALARFCRLAFRTSALPRQGIWLSTVGCAALLLSNFPIAGGIVATVIAVETRYMVVVHNASQQPLSNVKVHGGGCDTNFGTIPPDGIVRRSFWIQHEGELALRAVSGTSLRVQIIDGYVTHGMGGHTRVQFNPDGTISVTKRNA